MKLATLNIERFGSRSNLQLNELSDHLNVVFGPNGSGKTTIFNFLSWILYGNSHNSYSRYLHDSTNRATGSIVVSTDQRHRVTVSRTDDGTANGRVIFENTNYDSGFTSGQLSGVDAEEFRHIFALSFDSLPSIEQLIQTAATRGFDFTHDESQLRYLQDLEAKLARQRSDLGASLEPRTRLTERRRSTLQEIDSIEVQRRQRITDVERQRSEIIAELNQRKNELQQVQAWLSQLDATIQDRENQLEAAAREAENIRHAWIESRKKKVADIDYQIEHWHQVLETIRIRTSKLRSRLAKIEPTNGYTPVDDNSDVRYLMLGLGYQVGDIERDFTRPFDQSHISDGTSEYEYYRSLYGTALSAMRDDVNQLAEALRNYKAAAQQNEYESEIGQLRRCETELNDLVSALAKRRDSLMSQPATRKTFAQVPNGEGQWNGSNGLFAQKSTDRSVVKPWYESNGTAKVVNSGYNIEFRYDATQIRGVDPVLETRLHHLFARRHQVTPQVQRLETLVRDLEARLTRLSEQYRSDDHRIELLRQELVQIDEQTRLAETYEIRERNISTTEDEIARLRTGLNPSSLLREASTILGRLTEGRTRSLGINQSRQIVLEDATGRRQGYQELSRGGRDQCYLALCLALVSAYRRRGVHHPMVLNDVFVNIDAERTQATIGVLEEFASRGQQIVILTRHDHVMKMFADPSCKIFSLEPRNWTTPRADHFATRPLTPSPIRAYTPPLPPIETSPPIEKPLVRDNYPEAVPETKYEWVARWEKPGSSIPSESEPPTSMRSPIERGPDYTEVRIDMNSSLDSVSTIDSEFARWFREIDVLSVSQFLQLDADEAADRLRRYQLASSQVFRWQSEVLLQVYVGVGGIMAQIFVDCGIDDPEDLAVCDPVALYRRLRTYLEDTSTHRRYATLPRLDQSLLATWIERARSSGFRRRTYRTDSRTVELRAPKRVDLRTPEPLGPLEKKPPVDRAGEAKARSFRRRTGSARRSPANRNEKPNKATPQPAADTTEQVLKFHLELSDPIVNAPSIGPKTAERFEAIGVLTVGDFLEIEQDVAAEKIAYQRISADIVSEWQLQARLIYQIPNLRGHDAQILVACNVNSPSDLARADASTLFKEVKKFCDTTEGKRILRNGTKPDMAEVESWIEWSQHARELTEAHG